MMETCGVMDTTGYGLVDRQHSIVFTVRCIVARCCMSHVYQTWGPHVPRACCMLHVACCMLHFVPCTLHVVCVCCVPWCVVAYIVTPMLNVMTRIPRQLCVCTRFSKKNGALMHIDRRCWSTAYRLSMLHRCT